MRGLLRLWRRAPPAPPAADAADPIGETLRAVIDLHARTKVAASCTYERRVHAMMDDLFLNMASRGPRHDRR